MGTLRVPGSLESSRGVPAEVLRWSGDTERTRRRGIAAAESLTGGGVRGEASGVRLLGFGSAAGWNEMQGFRGLGRYL